MSDERRDKPEIEIVLGGGADGAAWQRKRRASAGRSTGLSGAQARRGGNYQV